MARIGVNTDDVFTSSAVLLRATYWRGVVMNQWYWLLLLVILASIFAALRRRNQCKAPADDEQYVPHPEVKYTADSPFFAYLGHNVLTESSAFDPDNTSFHAINRIPEHIQRQNAILAEMFEDTPEYDLNEEEDSFFPRMRHYRSYTYPDTRNKQVRIDHVEDIRDPDQDRFWQRRTVHVHGI